jgi:hypothetical protein
MRDFTVNNQDKEKGKVLGLHFCETQTWENRAQICFAGRLVGLWQFTPSKESDSIYAPGNL